MSDELQPMIPGFDSPEAQSGENEKSPLTRYLEEMDKRPPIHKPVPPPEALAEESPICEDDTELIPPEAPQNDFLTKEEFEKKKEEEIQRNLNKYPYNQE